MQTEASSSKRPRRLLIVAGLVVLVILAIGTLTVFIALEDSNSGAKAQEATTVDTATLPQTIPFANVAGHIVVDADLDGSGETVDFMLDSGAPVLYSDAIAARFGGEEVGQISARAIDNTVVEHGVVPVESLALGDAVFLDVAGIVGWVGPDNPLSCVTTNGLLGANLMKNAVWQIDYETQQVTIAPSTDGLDHIDGAIVFDHTSDTPHSPSPVIDLPVGDGSLSFLLDTGSDGGLTLNPADLEAVGLAVDDFGPGIDMIGAGASGTFSTTLDFTPLPLVLGDMEVTYPAALSETFLAGQGNIGNAFLSAFVVTIDWPANKVYLDPVSQDGSLPTPPEPRAAGVGWDGENIIVGSVVEGSAAAAEGLAPGAVVTSIDGRSYEAATTDDFCTLLTDAPPAGAAAASVVFVTEDGLSHEVGTVDGFWDSLGE